MPKAQSLMPDAHPGLGVVISTILGLLFPFNPANAQPPIDWLRIYNGPTDNGGVLYDVFATAEGGFAMTGSTGGRDRFCWLLITNRAGGVVHQSRHPEAFQNQDPICEGYSIIQDDRGGYLMGGQLRNRDLDPGRFGLINTNEEGDLIWWREYGQGICYAVIEEKAGNFVACGRSRVDDRSGAFVIKCNSDGDTIWTRLIDEDVYFRGLRETDEGYFLIGAGQGAQASVCRLEENGDVIEINHPGQGILYSLVSCRGGFLASGTGDNGRFLVMRLSNDGNLDWRRLFNVSGVAYGVARMPDEGFVLCGVGPGHNMLRIDRAGNEMWYREGEEFRSNGWQSVVTQVDGSAYIVGDYPGGRGALMKALPDMSPPVIVEWTPEDLQIGRLIDELISFTVSVEDIQNDEIDYRWYIDNVENDNQSDSLELAFDTSGVYIIECVASDETGADSLQWHVSVTDLYVSAFTPDTLDLALRRGSSVDFSLDTIRYTEGNEPDILWTKTNLSNGQSEETGRDAGATIDFPWSGEYSVEGRVSRGESSDAVTWHVDVKGAIWAFVPVGDSLEVLPDSVVHFEVVPSAPDDESLQVSWLVDGELVREGEMALDWVFGEADSSADLNRHYLVQCVVTDSVEADTVEWVVTVNDLGVGGDNEVGQAGTPILLSVSPNPFNSTLTIRFQSVKSIQSVVNISIYDISGREVANLPGSTVVTAGQGFHPVSAGRGFHPATEGGATELQITWDASGVPAGVYFVRLQAGGEVSMKKVVLIR